MILSIALAAALSNFAVPDDPGPPLTYHSLHKIDRLWSWPEKNQAIQIMLMNRDGSIYGCVTPRHTFYFAGWLYLKAPYWKLSTCLH